MEAYTIANFVRVLLIEFSLGKMLVSSATAATVLWVEDVLFADGLGLRHVVNALLFARPGVGRGGVTPTMAWLLLQELLWEWLLLVLCLRG